MDIYKYLPECSENPKIDLVLDKSSGDKKLFIEGPTLIYDRVNTNMREYGKSVLTEAINKHTGHGRLESGGCIGELNHPLNDRSQTDPDRIAIKFTEVVDTGEYYKTKALVAEGTIAGKQVAGLFEAGIRMGISARGYGTVKKEGKVSKVQKLFLESLGDIVFEPSAPGAYMQSIREGKQAQEYILQAGNLLLRKSSAVEEIMESHLDIIHKTPSRKLNEAAYVIFNDFLEKMII